MGLGRTLSTLVWDTGKIVRLSEVEHGTHNRFNDAKCDANGRLWAGKLLVFVLKVSASTALCHLW